MDMCTQHGTARERGTVRELTSQITIYLAIAIATVPVALSIAVFVHDAALAYDRLGFSHEEDCLRSADLVQKEGLLNSTSYQKLVDICRHAE